jgi:glycosyltransferase involved in cell wall biosynthesis
VHVAILQHTFNPTTLGWVRGLEARGHTVTTIVSHTKEPHGGWDEDLRVVVVPDDMPAASRLVRRFARGRKGAVTALPRLSTLRRALIETGADTVLIKVYSLRNVLAAMLALRLGLRRVAWIEQTPPIGREWRVLRALRVLPRTLLTPTDARPGGIAHPLDPPVGGLPVITYAPVLPEQARGGRGGPESDGPLRLLMVGALWASDLARKRHDLAVRAALAAGLAEGRCHLTFVGLGREGEPLPSAVEDALRSTPEGAITVRMNIPHRAMGPVYAAHDVLLLPSLVEQFGMVVPEAMAHGLAVVASDVVGARGCIVPGETGLLFPVADEAAFVAAVRRLVAEPRLAVEMGDAGRAFVTRFASPDVTAEALEHHLLSARRGRAGAQRPR